MELQKYMRGGLDVSEAEVDSLWTPYADAQRALDAEREKVKELVANQAEYEKCTDEQITALNQGCLDYEKQIATLQAQLAEIEQILCIESGKTTVDKVRDLHHSFKQVWNSYQGAGNDLFDMQAQLRQVEALCSASERLLEDVIGASDAADTLKRRTKQVRATLAARDAGKADVSYD